MAEHRYKVSSVGVEVDFENKKIESKLRQNEAIFRQQGRALYATRAQGYIERKG